jgi:hypothetical protein
MAAGALNGLEPIGLGLVRAAGARDGLGRAPAPSPARASSARVGGTAVAAVFQRLKQRWMPRLSAYRRKMQAAVFQRAK